jgi:hypothetical protein
VANPKPRRTVPNREHFLALSRFIAESGSEEKAARHLGVGGSAVRQAIDSGHVTPKIVARLKGLGRIN